MEQSISQMLERIPQHAELQAACQAENAPAWLVGGCVRDFLLNRIPADIDVTTPHPEPLAQRFVALIDGRVVPMDPERGIWRVAVGPKEYFDFCAFRDTDILGDLAGRDFTINAIALRIPDGADATGGLLDPFHGIDDLNNRVLRMVGPRAFTDDPARVLRAFRMVAELALQIENDTATALEAAVPLLPTVAPERLLAEWWRLCGGVRAATAIQQMDAAGALTVLFPELAACKGVTQNAYHRYDVWEHMLLAVTYMDRFLRHPEEAIQDLQDDFAPLLQDDHRKARLVLLALIHDLGKPATRAVKAGKVHFYGHEVTGAEQAERLCIRLRMSREDTRVITHVIRQHMRPLSLMQAQQKDGRLSTRAMIKFIDDTGSEMLEIMALSLADKSAGQGPAAEPDVLGHLREIYRQLFTFYRERYQPAMEQPLLRGNDLTDELHLPAGPQIGRILTLARHLQATGQLTTRDAAMRWAAQQR